MVKDNFLLHKEWIPLFMNLKPEQAGLLIQSICEYQSSGEIPAADSMIFAMFMMMKVTMDSDKEKYARECEKRRENANKRWLKEKMLEDASASECMQEQKNYADVSLSLSQSYSDSPLYSNSLTPKGKEDRGVGEEEKPKTPKKETQMQLFDRLIADQNIGLEMEGVLRKWIKYKTERKETYVEVGMKSMITQVQKAVHTFGEVAVMDQIELAQGENWKGMNLKMLTEQKGKNPQQRMDEAKNMMEMWKAASEEYERRKNDTG